MMHRPLFLATLGLAAVLPGAAFVESAHAENVWVSGHYESRQVRRVLPAETKEVCTPDRYEDVFIPAVTERVRVPAVTERVPCAPVYEKTWLPPMRERYWQHGYWDLSGWNPAHYEWRHTRGRYVERKVERDCFEDRVVRPARVETRVVVPERRESRLVERGSCTTVTVRPERVEVTYEKVWIPGHWENR